MSIDFSPLNIFWSHLDDKVTQLWQSSYYTSSNLSLSSLLSLPLSSLSSLLPPPPPPHPPVTSPSLLLHLQICSSPIPTYTNNRYSGNLWLASSSMFQMLSCSSLSPISQFQQHSDSNQNETTTPTSPFPSHCSFSILPTTPNRSLLFKEKMQRRGSRWLFKMEWVVWWGVQEARF